LTVISILRFLFSSSEAKISNTSARFNPASIAIVFAVEYFGIRSPLVYRFAVIWFSPHAFETAYTLLPLSAFATNSA